MNSELAKASDRYAPSLWWLPMAIVGGVLLGVAVGAFIGDLTYKPDPNSFDLGRGFDEAAGAVLGGLVGAGVGSVSFIFWRECRKAQKRRLGH
jgi:hypothetical protein